jgi:hypothetical protein
LPLAAKRAKKVLSLSALLKNSILAKEGLMRLYLMVLVVLTIGCSPLQIRKVIFGTSLHDFDIAQKKYTKIVAIKPQDCFRRVIDILRERQAIIKKRDFKNNFIVAYGFNDFFKSEMNPDIINTTEVGILFKENSPGKTEIILISDDSRLALLVSEEIFNKL